MPVDRRAMRTIRVELDERSYDVAVGAGLLPTLGARTAAILGHDANPARAHAARRAFIIYDDALPQGAIDGAAASLADAGYTVAAEGINASERAKSFAAAEGLLVALARSRHERSDPVIGLGGGVTGDLAGFVASIYRRGVPVIQCPSSLLAMVDASVGGKTAVNLGVPGEAGTEPMLLKNLVGTFHQPAMVLCDVRLLATLPDLELRCGLAECIKHGLLAADWRDADLLEWTAASMRAILGRDETYLTELVARNVAVKAAVVAADEREEGVGPGGGRLALNLGHTVAHAIETIELPSLGRSLKHGEAVGLGLLAEAACGERIGATAPGCADRIAAMLADAGLPRSAPNLPPSTAIAARMLDDKKTAGGRMRLALPGGDGRCRIVIDPPPEAVIAGLDRIRA